MEGKGGNSMMFPMPASPQRLSLGGAVPRKKVVLKPGRSLMDWIKLGRSGKDLTGVGGQVLNVTQEELARHNTVKDAWIAIRGKVYNITPYMEFHPGGQEELMRGAGIDGTQLFDEIHKWVNAESMLEKCFVGHLSESPPSRPAKKKAASVPREEDARSKLPSASPNGSIFKAPFPQPPTYDWFQNSKSVTVVVYTRCKQIHSDHVDIDRTNKNLLIIVTLSDQFTYSVHVELQEEVTSDYGVRVHPDSGKVEVTLPKVEADKHWSSLGKPQPKDKVFLRTTETETVYRNCKVESISEVTHDTKLLCITPPEGCRHCVPCGHHIHIRHHIEGMQLARSYTAVLRSLRPDDQDPRVEQGQAIYLMIKIYPDGVLTPWINTLQPGDDMSVSASDGSFDISLLSGVSHLMLFAAGTGFTPMVRLIYHTIVSAPEESSINVHLMFYNKRQIDIMWRDQLDSLAAEHSRFKVTYVLSDEDGSWTGLTGRVCKEHIEENVPLQKDGINPLVCACGPKPFTVLVVEHAKQYGLTDENIHAFVG